jgi:glycosyltransferase involved in cell wall biosynthesis
MSIKSITHLTSVHPRYDTRIFFKECISLTEIKNYKVNLIVADSLGDEVNSKVFIYDVGKAKNRIQRIFHTTKKVFNKAVELKSDIYHIHDPELIPIGLKLKKIGKIVIFDVHEHISLQIQDKKYLNKALRKILSKFYIFYEKYALAKFDFLILAEDSYVPHYERINNICTILNMPDTAALKDYIVNNRVDNGLFYIGGISNERGLDVTIDAIKILKNKYTDIYMHYIGNTYNDILRTLDLKDIQENIKFYGHMPLHQGLEISKHAKVGLSILKPLANYRYSYSTKIFEYMAIGLPVVTSNFALYKNIIEKYNCGICVDPQNPQEIADAIDSIISSPQLAYQMGQNGQEVVEKYFNWNVEKTKLFDIYYKLLQEKSYDA